jgi:hypothetical protein
MIPSQKICLIAFFAIVAVFAAAISPSPAAFAQDVDSGTHDDKTYEDKSGKSCPGKNKEGMST